MTDEVPNKFREPKNNTDEFENILTKEAKYNKASKDG